ncbi:MAG: hypothetical protein DWC02_04400 [Candidatus Poseidoniales archaeon]|nr:MAG: hypothetical protein DWC02_04400 [Candidatus Poseidoniales archaeon]
MDEFDEELEQELHEFSQEIGQKIIEISEKIHPVRVAIAGLVMLLILGAIAASWYWVIPRDDVEIEVKYLQRNGHIVLTEIVNDGSREITNVQFKVEFVDKNNEVIDFFEVNLDSIPSHSSVSGDEMELVIQGYTVWEEYSIEVSIKWTNFKGVENVEKFIHYVSDAQTAVFTDECEEVNWFL